MLYVSDKASMSDYIVFKLREENRSVDIFCNPRNTRWESHPVSLKFNLLRGRLVIQKVSGDGEQIDGC